MQSPVLDELEDLTSSEGWLRLGESAMGMYYDIDAAILKTLKVDDDQFSIRFGPDGSIVADVWLPTKVRSLRDLDLLFYRFWSKISFPLSVIKREAGVDAVSYRFTTGDSRLGYRGTITLRGEHVRRLVKKEIGNAPASPPEPAQP